jgi:hypothetical protein
MRYLEILNEGRVLNIHISTYRDIDMMVWQNPSFQQRAAFLGKPIRGIVDQEHDLYLWDGMIATHDDVEDALGISGRYYIFVSGDEGFIVSSCSAGGGNYPDDDWLSYPNVQRFWKGPPLLTDLLKRRFAQHKKDIEYENKKLTAKS